MKKKFNNNLFRFNCIYLQSNSIYLNKFAIKFFNKVKIPIIHNQNGIFYKGWYGKGWEDENKKMSFQLHAADYVFYQSNFSKNCSDEFLGVRKGPNEILYNAVDTKEFYPIKKKLLGSEIKILVTGKYQEHLYYSLEFATKVLNKLIENKIKAIIEFAGYYEPSVIRKIFNFAKKYNIKEKIKFSGVYKQEDANLVYNSADIYFYFVHQSNCPNSVMKQWLVVYQYYNEHWWFTWIVIKIQEFAWKQKSWDRPFTPDIIDAFNGVNNIFDNYSDYSNNCIIKIAKDHNIINWINKHEEVFNKLRWKY